MSIKIPMAATVLNTSVDIVALPSETSFNAVGSRSSKASPILKSSTILSLFPVFLYASAAFGCGH